MLDPVLGPILGAGISGIANLIGGFMGRDSTERANEQNIALQREFAQNAVRWKVEDARAAGVSPLYALGAPTMSFSPSVVGDTSMPAAMSAIGQDIGRAVDAGISAPERMYNDQVKRLTLERMSLENRLLGAQIVATGQPRVSAVPDVTGVRIGGYDVAPNTGFSDAQEIQTRYGEPAEYIYFPMVAGADALQNIFGEKGSALNDWWQTPLF